ncbi:hypothetical protein IT415_03180 [bacterium]|nr:hypothetical protein [bacterium]
MLVFLLMIIAVVGLIWYDNRHRGQPNPSQQHLNQPPNPILDQVTDEVIADRVERLAMSAKTAAESEVLHRAARSIRAGMQTLLAKGVKLTEASKEIVEIAPAAVHQQANLKAVTIEPPKPPVPSLAERSRKMMQNANVLLYLGAFLIVIAAGTFVGSNYGSIDSMTKVVMLGALTAAFYISGLCLYRLTKRFQPAGITFAAIGLLMVPLVGLAVQTLLYDGQPAAPIWLATTAIALVLQLLTYALIRKSYIVYFSALTTVSLFQSLTATLEAPVYWYGWVMMLTSLAYIFLARVMKDRQLVEALDVSAQVFVPISVVLSLLGWEEFGSWAIGTQLVLTAAFYLVCAGLRDFDQSDAEVTYLGLAATLFPIGFGLVLHSRQVPMWVIAVLLLLIGLSYVVGDKYAPEARHKPIYAALAIALSLVAPMLPFDGQQSSVLTLGSAAILLSHYVLTRRHEVYAVFLLVLTSLPYICLTYLMPIGWAIGQIALVYALLAIILSVVSEFVLSKIDDAVAEMQDAVVVIWTVLASVMAVAIDPYHWGTGVLIASSMSYFLLARKRRPQMIIGAMLGINAFIIVASAQYNWQPAIGYVLALASGVGFYALYKALPSLKNRPRLMGVSYGAGLLLAFGLALSDTHIAMRIAALVPVILTLATSFVEREKRVPTGLAVAGSYIVMMSVADHYGWSTFLTIGLWSAVIYILAWPVEDGRGTVARLSAVVGGSIAFAMSAGESRPAQVEWWSVSVGALAAGMTISESYRQKNRTGKYIGSGLFWLSVLRLYDAFGITISQVYVQTTAVYIAALAYRQYQRGERQAQDALTAGALFVSTVPLAFEALNDTTGGYTISIMGLGIVLIVAGMGMHYRLVRDWGIGTLVLIVLYKTAGFIFQLPGWVWFGVIGVGALIGAIYLLGRHTEARPDETES